MQSAGLEVKRSNWGVAVKKSMALGKGGENKQRHRETIRDRMASTWEVTG